MNRNSTLAFFATTCAVVIALTSFVLLSFGGLTSCNPTTEDTGQSIVDIKNTPIINIEPGVAKPHSVAVCTLYQSSPTIKMKAGSYAGPDDLFSAWFQLGGDLEASSVRKDVLMKKEVIERLFNDPKDLCASYYLYRLTLNDRPIYEVRAIPE